MKQLILTSALLTATLLSAPSAFASGETASAVMYGSAPSMYGTAPTQYGTSNCQPGYGNTGCVTPGAVLLEKTVQDPNTGTFVPNLTINDAKYAAGQKVTFHLTVTNTGQAALTQVTVKDLLPQYVTYTTADGSYDAKANTVTMQVASLNPGETKTFTVTVTVVDASQMPQTQGITCVTNQATVATSEGSAANAMSQFCIEQKVLGSQTPVFPTQKVTSTPSSGAETLPLLSLIPTALAGIALRKRTN